MRILILGASGLLGNALVQEWSRDEIVSPTSKDADIRNQNQLQTLFSSVRPDWTILAAAYTDVDGCEKNPALANEVNCHGAANVAQAAGKHGSRLMLISTDYVFSGTGSVPCEVNDPLQPLGVYGLSKAAAESRVREILPNCCIVRTSWLFGTHGKCFPGTILKLAREGKSLRVVSDQRGSPTFNRDLARAIIGLARNRAEGILHVANAGECSWFEFAQAILEAAGLEDVEIIPISAAESRRPAPRPRYSVLSCTSLRQRGITMRPWQETIPEFLRESLPTIGVGARAISSLGSTLIGGGTTREQI